LQATSDITNKSVWSTIIQMLHVHNISQCFWCLSGCQACTYSSQHVGICQSCHLAD